MGTFPVITGAGTTTGTKFFGDAMNRLSNMLNGVDISADAVVTINSATTWTFQNTSFRIQNPAATHIYTFTPAAITADRTLNLPLLTGTDTLAVLALQQTFTNKNLNASSVEFIDNADNTKILAFSLTGITTGNTRTLTIPDVSSTIAVTGLAQTFTTQQTISPTVNTALVINPPTAPTGSASEFIGTVKKAAGTIAFATIAQTGDFISNKFDQATLTNPSSGTITNASTLKIVGAPIASTNVTITNNYALWVAAGNSLFAGTLTSTGGITMSNSDITLAGNNLKTTNFNIFDALNEGRSLNIQSSFTNSYTQLSIIPNGTSNTAALQIFRNSNYNTTSDTVLLIGTDLNASNGFDFVSFKAASGTQEAIRFWMGATKLLSFDTANTITSYVQTNFNVSSTATQITSNGIIIGGNGTTQSLLAGSFALQFVTGTGIVNLIDGGGNQSVSFGTNKQVTFSGTIFPQTSTGTTGQFAFDSSSGANITIANNATATPFGSSTPQAVFKVTDTSSGKSALFFLGVDGTPVILSQGTSTEFTVTQGTGGKTNVYTVASVVTIENKTGGSVNYKVSGDRFA